MPLPLHILQLLLGHAEIMTEFMYESLADLMAHFRLIGADRLNVLLIKHDVIRSCGQVEDAPLRRRHAVKDAQKQSPALPQLGWSLVRWKIFNKDRDVLDADSELFQQRIQSFFCDLDEIFALHPAPLTQTAHPHRVASVILFLVVTLIVRDVSFIFLIVLFLVWLFPKKDIGSRRAIRRICVEAVWAYSAHVHMVLCARWQEQRVLVAGDGGLTGNARIG